MHEVCDVCGSMSNPQLMATCSECKEISEHIYCMLVLRVEMPKEWCCELCKPTCKAISSPIKDLSMKKSKVKFLPMDEIFPLTSGCTASTSKSYGLSNSENRVPASDKSSIPAKASVLKLDSVTKHTTKMRSARKCSFVCHNGWSIKTKSSEVDIPNQSEGLRTSMQPIETHVEANGQLVSSSEVMWKGRIEIRDVASIVYDGIQAHFPGEVSKKAFDVSKRLPGRLKMEVLPRVTIWPKSFQLDGPFYEDIAFYLLPVGNTRPEYVCLLENVSSQDLGMRCCQGDVELLLFSSKQLPFNSQRKNGDLYLWGIFLSIKGISQEIHSYERSPTPDVPKGEVSLFHAPPGFSSQA